MPKEQSELDRLLNPLRVVIGLVGLMVVGGLIAGAVFISSLRANDRAIIRQRDEARRTVCLRDNKQSDDAVAYARGQAQVLIAFAYRNRTPTPTEREVSDSYTKAQEDQARKLFPKRVCTKKAIDDYYTRQAAAQ
jgi:hypothetical protein